MRDLKKIFYNCIAMMDEIGMDYGNISKVEVNTRAKNRWGQCKHKYIGKDPNGNIKYDHSINISSILLDERVPIESLENTIIHEILHTCPGCQNHGPEWKRRAAKVKKELGYDIKRCDSEFDKGINSSVVSDYYKPKYIVKCTGCGREVSKQRMCSMIKTPQYWRCGVCGGKFERIM